ncbi:hypothetical protein [Skermanella aerolata]|uniref:hypothetical protein n=1 Tax=Skermanella aerolata TaxID=393310 RepID=UPI0011BF426E|nr:hypothetical protein [Skermanella aerolata]
MKRIPLCQLSVFFYQMLIMLRWTLTAGIRLVIVLAMALGALPVSNILSLSHDSLKPQLSEVGQHSPLSEGATAEHTHFDDEEVSDEWEPGHNHRHNPADHSHDTPGPAPILCMAEHEPAPDWQLLYRFSLYWAPASRMDRPPRPLFAV